MRDQLLAHWAQLAPRERIMVIVAGTALTLTLLFLLVWEPLVQTRQQRAAALDGARAVAVRLEEIAAELGPAAQQSRPTVPAGALLATVDRAARAGLGDTPPSRIQPEQDREVRVWIDEIAFENLLRWVDELEQKQGVRAQTIDLERGEQPGRVNARLTLVRAS
ncbi:MAG: type II secretion system protein M [Polycyclovorans sp.]|mgnify:FL=1|jgi:general secretion pathway protein M|nr:hypothetical protein [Polycyclovorans sp.]MBU0789059.1 type II secretion system protein M [Gammaproteobacteria bacterium]MDP1543510.1 type II secretion system protein M [Polycyclovorans sp.]MEC8849145.1 type II secretion system protein M [Pseudomonadota bacterium]|tara:strand:+ start:9066 stop:9557 length:492 start_codon:yes stop_codon:yes gene_type:complete